MSTEDILRILQETADLIELTGGNPHRARAFARAARSLETLEDSVADRIAAGTLTEISGIGDAMAKHVAEISRRGSFELYDELRGAVPPGLLEVMQVQGLGTQRTRQLWTDLNVTSLDDVERAAENDRISSLSGFGAKTQKTILENVRRLRRYHSQWRLAEAWSSAQALRRRTRDTKGVLQAELTGALRRCQETVEQIELLVATERPETVRNWAENYLEDSTSPEPSRVEGTLVEGLPVLLHLTPPDRFGTVWWRKTGSPSHCTSFEEAFGVPGWHAAEKSVFSEADVPTIPPELREDRGEITAAADGTLPSLLPLDDLEGCLHNHSNYSDGSTSLREMAEAAYERGFTYFGICDHSQSLRIADGLSPEEVQHQRNEVDRLNEEFSERPSTFHVFHGIESDILGDGSLDYDRRTLESFDFVVASIHTRFNMTEEEATDRLIRAVENPYTRILGHPTGRLLLQREGYPIDHSQVIDACAKHGVALELNANPHRLDLDWRWIRRATKQDVLISVNPDAHAPEEIDSLRWGLAVGRKGWLTPHQCLNAKSLDDFRQWLDHGVS